MNQNKTETNRIAVCPSCNLNYSIPESLVGRVVSCKKCGNEFKLSLDDGKKEKGSGKVSVVSRQGPEGISPDDSFLVLGKLAVKYKLITPEQLRDAVSTQKREREEGRETLLGEILVGNGLISRNQLDFLLSIQRLMEKRNRDRRFGLLAIKKGYASKEDIQRAMEEQQKIFKKTRNIKPIGDLLIEWEIITREQRDAILLNRNRSKQIAPDEIEKAGPSVITGEEMGDIPFDLTVTEDGLAAFISKKQGVSGEMAIEKIRDFLQAKGIKHGIVDDSLLEGYLKYKVKEQKPWKIAGGKPPQPGKDAELKYYFETDPLKVGKVKDGGTIDFKDRGDIPQVKKGDLLVEKKPVREGVPGIDVFGNPIIPKKPKDVRLRHGKGASISEDGLKIYSEAEGRPEKSASGKVSVFAELKISGDVDLKTGHVVFDGDIHVEGTVKPGFHVKGGSLFAREIVKADINIEGDIALSGGVIGSKIRNRGNIQSRYIRETDIETFGNVIVEKEIIDSKIETSGSCIVKKGDILSSTIIAKKGIEAIQIGSETSKPCILTVGTDERVQNEINGIKELISLKEKEQEKYSLDMKKLDQESKEINQEIGIRAQEQDRIMVSLRDLQENLDKFQKESDTEQLEKVKAGIKGLEAEMKKKEEVLEDLFGKQDGIEEKVSTIKQKIKDLETEIRDLSEEITVIKEWSESEKRIPVVKAHGAIFSYTTVKGAHSSLYLPQDHRNVILKEKKIRDPDDNMEWKVVISRL